MELISAFLGGCLATKWLGHCVWLSWWAIIIAVFLKCLINININVNIKFLNFDNEY